MRTSGPSADKSRASNESGAGALRPADKSRACVESGAGALRPPGPVAAPLASSLRAPSRPVPPRRAFGRGIPAGGSNVGERQVLEVTLRTLFVWPVSAEYAV